MWPVFFFSCFVCMWCPYKRVSPHVYTHFQDNTLLFILCNDYLNQCDSHILLVNKFIPYWWGVINFCGATNYKSCLCNNFSPWCDEIKEIFQPYWERTNEQASWSSHLCVNSLWTQSCICSLSVISVFKIYPRDTCWSVNFTSCV